MPEAALETLRDWEASPLGPSAAWPEALRAAARIVFATPTRACVFWGAAAACLPNRRFLAMLGRPWAAETLGEPAPALLGEAAWAVLGPDVQAVLAGGPATLRDSAPVGQGRYWSWSCTPLGEEGGPRGVLLLVNDASAAEAARVAAEEAQAVARTLFDAAPFTIIVIDPASHQVLEVNEHALAEYGYSREEFLALRIGDIDALGDAERIRARGRAHAVRPGVQEFEARHRWKDGTVRDVLVRVAGVRLGGRDVTYGGHFDITDRKAAEGRQQLLMRELNHRARNLLSVVQAALRLTPRDDPRAYFNAVEGRVTALARAHALLAEAEWQGAELRPLLAGELAPFLAGQRVELDGPDLLLPAAATQPLAMVVHELATNAVKHGALSVPAGRLRVAWGLEDAPGRRLRLDWAETGGPVVAGSPTRRGFGSRVLEATVQGQMHGQVVLDWRPEGLACRLDLPLEG